MAITIKPIPASTRLQVSGDLKTVLHVPFEDDDRFFVGVSDGTLLLGIYDEELRCSWTVVREGAGITHIYCDQVAVEWAIEWITAGIYNHALDKSAVQSPLPLFPEIDQFLVAC